jgi:DNA-binding SARP family transcriptional activator
LAARVWGAMPQAIEINVLGAVDVRRGGGAVSVPGAKARTVLTLLGLNAGEVVSAETMQEVLWGEHAPRTAHKALQTHISTLRQVLGEGTVVTAGGGWMLTVDSVDARAFEEFTQAGRQAMRDGSPEAAVTHFSDALRLWRGQPELPPTVRAEAELTRWREARESVRDDCVDARLAGGEAAALVGEIEKALAADPLREKRWAQLCIALYRSGRQGDALKAYRRARSVLIDELGLEPSPELRRIEAAILNHDVALPAAAGATRDPLRGTRGAPDTARGGAGVPTIPALPAPPTAFIGRSAELARRTGFDVSCLPAHGRALTFSGDHSDWADYAWIMDRTDETLDPVWDQVLTLAHYVAEHRQITGEEAARITGLAR